jgi:hypothetical protein
LYYVGTKTASAWTVPWATILGTLPASAIPLLMILALSL